MTRKPRSKSAKVGSAGSKVNQTAKGVGYPVYGQSPPGRVFFEALTSNIDSRKILAHMEENPDLFTPELIITYKEKYSL